MCGKKKRSIVGIWKIRLSEIGVSDIVDRFSVVIFERIKLCDRDRSIRNKTVGTIGRREGWSGFAGNDSIAHARYPWENHVLQRAARYRCFANHGRAAKDTNAHRLFVWIGHDNTKIIAAFKAGKICKGHWPVLTSNIGATRFCNATRIRTKPVLRHKCFRFLNSRARSQSQYHLPCRLSKHHLRIAGFLRYMRCTLEQRRTRQGTPFPWLCSFHRERIDSKHNHHKAILRIATERCIYFRDAAPSSSTPPPESRERGRRVHHSHKKAKNKTPNQRRQLRYNVHLPAHTCAHLTRVQYRNRSFLSRR